MTRAKRHKSRLLFLVSFIFLLLVLGCGRKGPPVAPQAVVPPAVKDLKAEIMADDVVLTWSIPKRGDTIKANYMGYLQLSRRNARGYKGSRGQGVKGSSELLKNHRDLKVWGKSYELCLET